MDLNTDELAPLLCSPVPDWPWVGTRSMAWGLGSPELDDTEHIRDLEHRVVEITHLE